MSGGGGVGEYQAGEGADTSGGRTCELAGPAGRATF